MWTALIGHSLFLSDSNIFIIHIRLKFSLYISLGLFMPFPTGTYEGDWLELSRCPWTSAYGQQGLCPTDENGIYENIYEYLYFFYGLTMKQLSHLKSFGMKQK